MIFEIISSGSDGNCYLIKGKNYRLLIDPGINFDKIAKYLNYDFTNLSVLLSHSHSDHSKSIKDLVKRGIKCYCRRETRDELKVKSHNIIPFSFAKSSRNIKIDNFEITMFDLPHSIKNCGFFIRELPNNDRLVYAIDCNKIPYTFAAEHICVECNYDKLLLDPLLKDTNKWHMEFDECINFLAESVNKFTKEIVLLHISQRHGDKEKFVNDIQKIYNNIIVRSE